MPDRFEALRKADRDELRAIIHPVEPALEAVDERFAEMRASGRGGLTVLRGETGSGKSTFLDTISLFRSEVVTKTVPGGANPREMLSALGVADRPRIVVLEGREALRAERVEAIEEVLHAVNEFVRADVGADTLVVWPSNTDDLTAMLVEVGGRLGGEALFGVGQPVERFSGPPPEAFVQIAEQTVQAFNTGASLAVLGISEEHARQMAAEATTVGHYMGLVREALLTNGSLVRGLLRNERYRLWTLVIAGNEPENDVAAITRGSQGFVDVDRLLTATQANVVKDLKKAPEKVGLLATSLDSRILHMDMLTALALARAHGDEALHALMRGRGMAIVPSKGESVTSRLESSELGVLLAADVLGPRRRGSRPGGSTRAAFASLAQIARTDDGAINRTIGEGLKAAGLIESFEPEKDLGTELNFASDLYLLRAGEPIRLEVMWRRRTSRAEIANYSLRKLSNYGRAIGFLE